MTTISLTNGVSALIGLTAYTELTASIKSQGDVPTYEFSKKSTEIN